LQESGGSEKPLQSRTLQITKPFGRTLLLGLFLSLLLIGTAELAARWEFFQSRLSPPKLGSRHYQLGHKLALLDESIKKNGPLDCVFVGSSIVDLGFDPQAFRNGYRQATGEDIHCFNFGIDASSATSTAAIARILVEDYSPRFLIFGTDARDYAVPADDNDPAAILETDWVGYRQGKFSVEGWLTEHSYLFRYRSHLSRLMRFQFEETLLSQTKFAFEILPNGFTPFDDVGTYINDPPEPDDDSFAVRYFTKIYTSYEILDENVAALEQVLELGGESTKVFVVEMPVADGMYYFFGNGAGDYQKFVDRVKEVSNRAGTRFWITEPLDMIPDDGWVDYNHVNVEGAEIFSTWFGLQIGGIDN
jgi:hypothetical protein